jgi:hypothetical protein
MWTVWTVWTVWSEANQNSITWTSFHVSSAKTSMTTEISSLNIDMHRMSKWHEESNTIWQAAPLQRDGISNGAEVGEVWPLIRSTQEIWCLWH